MRTADAAVLRLVDRGVAVMDENVFIGSDVVLPPGPGPFITVMETAGRGPIPVHNAKALRQPALQLTVRGDLMSDVEPLVELSYDALGGDPQIANELIGDVFFLWMRPASDIFSLPNDAEGRVRLAFNVNFLRR